MLSHPIVEGGYSHFTHNIKDFIGHQIEGAKDTIHDGQTKLQDLGHVIHDKTHPLREIGHYISDEAQKKVHKFEDIFGLRKDENKIPEAAPLDDSEVPETKNWKPEETEEDQKDLELDPDAYSTYSQICARYGFKYQAH